MKFLGIFCLCFLLSGVRTDLLSDLSQTLGVGDLSTTLTNLAKTGLQTAVSTLLSSAVSSLFGKRNVDPVILHAVSEVKHEAGNLQQVFNHYGADLQAIYDQIHSLDFLKHNPEEFLNNINKIVETHNGAINSIMQHLASGLSHLEHSDKRALTGFLSGLQSAVNQLKQTFGGVANSLHENGGGLLSTLTQQLGGATTHLQSTLEGLKGTASQLIAQGQEAIASLSQHATDALAQTHDGLLGAAHQAIDTFVHPQVN